MEKRSNKIGRFAKRCGNPILIIFLLLLFLTIWSWRKWPDLLIDFGRELYVPWQLMAGKILYKDIAYLNGPLSPYLNALWFKLFGISFITLALCNLVILFFFTYIIYFYIYNKCDRLTATLSGIVFLSIFAFGHLMRDVGNYNFICPYSHEMTHGIILASIVIILLSSNINPVRYFLVILSGLLFGLVFLGKGEILLALAGATVFWFFAIYFTNKISARKMMSTVFLFILASIIPIAIGFFYLFRKMPASIALHGIAGTWNGLLSSDVANNIFYKECTGFDKPWQNLFMMLRGFAGVAVLICALIVTDYFSKENEKGKGIICLIIIPLLALLCIIINKQLFPLLLTATSLPIIVLIISISGVVYCIRTQAEKAVFVNVVPLVLWSVFAFVLMGKIILHPQLGRYGFVLSLPATILFVVGLLWILPEIQRRRYGGGRLFRWLASIFLIADVIFFLRVSNLAYSEKDFVVGNGGDAIISFGPEVNPEGYAVANLLKHIASSLPPHATLAVIPEGVMINYLSRRVNPGKYINLMPPEISIYGENNILDSLKTLPPEFIVLIHKKTKEYGKGFFGSDPTYGKHIMDWINLHYVPIWHILDEPLKDDHFGIKMMKRKSEITGAGLLFRTHTDTP